MKKRRILWIGLGLLLLVYLWRLCDLQEKYSIYATEYYELGAVVTERELEFTIDGYCTMTMDEFSTLFGSYDWGSLAEYVEDTEEVYYLVHITVTNLSEEEKEYSYMISMVGSTWSTGYSLLELERMGATVVIKLAPGETKEYIIPYSIAKSTFVDRWDFVQEETKTLVFSSERTKRVVTLSEEDCWKEEWTISALQTAAEAGNEIAAACLEEKIEWDQLEETSAESFEYEVVELTSGEKGVRITWYLGKETQIKIPEEIEGLLVVELADELFKDLTAITAVYIPDSVAVLGMNLFNGCSSLKQVRLPEGECEVIPEGCFANCTSLMTVQIPNGYIEISNQAFAYCTSLKTISLAESVKKLGDRAFAGCLSLTGLDLTYLTEIGQGAFNASGLVSVTLGRDLEELGASAFRSCLALEEILVDEENEIWRSIDGILYQGETLVCCPAGYRKETVEITEKVVNIADGAFYECANICVVTLPESVVTIGASAFSGCLLLERVVLEDGVSYIGEEAFLDCSCLQELNLPDGICFADCDDFRYFFFGDEELVISWNGRSYTYAQLMELKEDLEGKE